MAKTATTIATMFFLVTAAPSFYGAWAQAPTQAPMGPSMGPSMAPGPSGPDCMTLLLGMADCLSYVQIGSNLTTPDKPCCPELKSLVDTNPICLCQLLAKGGSSAFQIDISRATKLPSVCKVDTPPPSTCSLIGIPVGSPTSSEGPNAASPPVGADGLPLEGSPAAPPTSKKNDGNRASTSIVAVLLGFATIFFSY
ncbi:non-specific lipid transfer protein GPI-anchored 11-like [Humulus lupulus]|uniref:non-specific lipid transfer protein GPI-anchored 11-like n=1 Tax=Humulus lupulus TaxID=3486 RepID=UPI002B40D243|nr:non-specific lipid transfer protein GPI-anchored 11-like [Humulus lupulus]